MPTPKLQQVADAMDKGDQSKARELLMLILADDLRNVDALLWMAAASETADERQKWLYHVLEVDPKNKQGIRGLEVLGIAYQSSQEQLPITEQTSVDQPSPEREPVAAQPAISTEQTTSRKKSRSAIRIVLLLVVIVIGAVFVNNYMQTRAYLDRWNSECDGLADWLRASRDRMSEAQQIGNELSKQMSQDTASATALVQILRDESDKLANLEEEQRSSQPPKVAQEINTKWMQFFTLAKTGTRLVADGIETDNTASMRLAENIFAQSLVALNEGNALVESIADQCK